MPPRSKVKASTSRDKSSDSKPPAERVLNKKIYKGYVHYEVKWVDRKQPTWVKEADCYFPQLIREFNRRLKRKACDEDEDEWEVEKILDKRVTTDDKVEYLVKWKNWDGDHQWIAEKDCLCINLIAAYENPKLRKMWNFQGSNPNLWIDRGTIIDYMENYITNKEKNVNLLHFMDDFPDDEKPLKLKDGLNIGPLCYKDHWYLVVIFMNHMIVDKRLLVGDPLNTLFGSPGATGTHPVFRRMKNVYPRIPSKPLTMTPMDRSDVCGYYILAAFERALFVYASEAPYISEKLLFDYARPERIRQELRPETRDEFSVAITVKTSYLTGPRCEFCEQFFDHQREVDRHIKREHFNS